MLLQMYENPIAGEDWQTKNVTENNKAWFKKKITKCFICWKGNISLKTLRYFAKKKNIPFFKFLNIIYSGVNETNYMLCINFSKPVRASTEKIPGVLKHTLLSVEHFMIVRKSKETELSSYMSLYRSGHFRS